MVDPEFRTDFAKDSLNRTLAALAVIASILIFAVQDVWVAALVRDREPLVLTFWIFLGVTAIAFLIAIFRGERLPLNRATLIALARFNLSTAFSWGFTFLALSRVSPNVVSAATLSTPPIMIMLLVERKLRLNAVSALALFSVILGLLIGLCSNSGEVKFDYIGLIYCALASVGVVGNSICMRALNMLGCKGNPVLSSRFIFLLGGIGLYYILEKGSIPLPAENFVTISALTLVTTYIPLLILYFAHLHLSIYRINIGLAMTPVATFLIVGLIYGTHELDVFQYISLFLVVAGVLIEFGKGVGDEQN